MMQAVDEMAAHREGKITLREVEVDERTAPSVTRAMNLCFLKNRFKTKGEL